jgi:hypothetical protein
MGNNAGARRHCHFKNVCARLLPLASPDTKEKETIELTYFKPPYLVGGPQIWSTSQKVEDPWVKTDRDHSLRKVDVYEPMPEDARYVKEPTVLTGSFWVRVLSSLLPEEGTGADCYPFRSLTTSAMPSVTTSSPPSVSFATSTSSGPTTTTSTINPASSGAGCKAVGTQKSSTA